MIEQNQLKPLRKVAIADHLWACFEQMAQEMGTDREGLVNQALFMFARLNGFLVPSSGSGVGASAAPPLAAVKAPMRAAPIAPPPPEPEPDFDEAAREAEADQVNEAEEQQQEEAYEEPEAPPPPPPPAPRAPTRAPPAPPMLSGPRPSRSAPEAPAPVDRDEGGPPRLFEGGAPTPKPLDEDPVRRAVAKQVLETAAELEKLIKGKNEAARPPPAAVSSDSTNSGANPDEKLLFLAGDDGEMLKVGKERFLIGRGKHCDLVINSGKVSREHAAVVRDGTDFFIEDLGSSNGTWFNKQRIKRRKVEEGDEYFICSEKIRCTFR